MKNTTTQTATHYTNVATSYNESFFAQDGSDYQRWQLDHIARKLRLQSLDQVVDLGCGTGVFSTLLHKEAGLTQNIVAVDPSQSMLDEALAFSNLTTYCADALTFVQDSSIRYDKILMNSMIHHIPLADLSKLYRGIYRQLNEGGIMLTVTRPVEASYPFFQAAYRRWMKDAHPLELLVQHMAEAGFSTSYKICYYPAQVSKEKWFEMIRNRFWSTFSYFNDEEIEAGIAELQLKHANTNTLHFEEALILIEAIKSQ